jgi:hypothetical protein
LSKKRKRGLIMMLWALDPDSPFARGNRAQPILLDLPKSTTHSPI